MGVINLDLMDLRTILSQAGRSTVLVGEGMAIDPERLFRSAFDAPLERMDIANAAACLLHIEGGGAVSLGDFDQIAAAFTRGLHENCNVIYGASIDKEMTGEVRVIAVLSGL
jgi:cell division protein FtsZ